MNGNLLSQLQLVDNGARWYKVDLHFHTPQSHDYKDRSISYKAIVEKAVSNSLDMIAVTDHNTGYGYEKIRFSDRASGASIFNNHVMRSKWNWQFTRELSLRVILQYDSVLANPELTALETSKNFNADFLITYLVNPWTALYIGYNGNAQNIDLVPTATGSEIIRHRRRFINDAKQFFVKFSYLLRF